MEQKISVSDLRPASILAAAALIALIALAVLQADITGGGLRTSMAYRLFGPALYALFYGMVAFLLLRLLRAFFARKSFLHFDGKCLKAGATMSIDICRTRVSVRKNWLGLKEVHFYEGDGHRLTLKAYSLTTSPDDISRRVEELQQSHCPPRD